MTEYNQSPENLRLLQAISDGTTDAVFAKDLQGRYLLFNKAAEQFVGKTASEVLGRDDTSIFPTAEALAVMEGDRKVVEGGVVKTYEDVVITASGRRATFLATKGPIFDAEKKIVGIFGISRDITERKRTEQVLQDLTVRIGSQEVFHVLVDAASEGFWLLDKQFMTVYVNPAVEGMLGYTKQEMVGRSWYDFGDPDWVARAKELEKRRATGVKEPHQFLFVHKDGRRVLARIATTPLYDKDGNFDGALGVLSDITRQTEAEDALKVKEMRNAIAQSAGIGMSILNPDHTIAWYNDQFVQWFGPLEKTQGRNCYEVFEGKTAICPDCPSKVAFQTGRVTSIERTGITTAVGAGRIIALTATPIRDSKGTVSQVVEIAQDVTDRKHMEMALEKRMVALTQPLDQASGVTFEDLFDSDDIQRIQDEFSAATGVASIITQPDGTPITRPSNFCRLCKDIIRCTDAGLRNCFHSDAIIGRYHPDGPVIQPCLSGGLWDAGASISVGGRHIANWLIGQVRDESQSEERVLEYARSIGADESGVIEAFREVPSMSATRFKHIAQMLFTMASQLSTLAYKNIQQARYITDRKLAEGEIQSNKVQLSNALEIAHLGHWEYDVAKDLFTFNDQFYKLFRTSVEQCGGYTMHSADYARRFVYPDDIDVVGAETRKAVETTDLNFSRQVEHRMLYADGTVGYIAVRFFIVKDSHGRTVRIYGVNQDITERKKAEAVLRESEEKFRLLCTAMDQGLALHEIVTDAEGKPVDYVFLDINDSYTRLLGVTREMSIGKRIREVMPKVEQYWIDMFGKVALTGESSYYENYLETTGRYYSTYSYCPKRNQFAVLVSDITERKRAEEREKVLRDELERAARMESLGVLAGGVAHDLNNVLGPIVVLPDMMKEYIEKHGDPADPEYTDIRQDLGTLKASALRAAAVVSDLVVMGRRGQIQKNPLDVNLLVEDMMVSKQIRAIQDRRPDVKITKKLTTEPVTCLGSDSRLIRVLANLVGNAAEAIDGQGDVVVRTDRRAFIEPYHGYDNVPPGKYIVIEVTDNGCGMDAKTITRIFEPFFSTKKPSERSGSGLGLSVVHGLVKDHAGFLDVKSELGKGTTFTIYLPAVDAAAQTVPAEAPAAGGNEKILVVDDEPGQQVLAKRALKKLGYYANAVSSGDEALKLYEEAAQAGEPSPFDLVITDMVMGGLDGMALCQNIQELYPGHKLIVASGHSAEEKQGQAKGLGIDWLVKPYTAEALARAVRARLDR